MTHASFIMFLWKQFHYFIQVKYTTKYTCMESKLIYVNLCYINVINY